MFFTPHPVLFLAKSTIDYDEGRASFAADSRILVRYERNDQFPDLAPTFRDGSVEEGPWTIKHLPAISSDMGVFELKLDAYKMNQRLETNRLYLAFLDSSVHLLQFVMRSAPLEQLCGTDVHVSATLKLRVGFCHC